MTSAITMETRSLDVIKAYPNKDPEDDLPSWVPQFQNKGKRLHPSRENLTSDYAASGTIPIFAQYLPVGNGFVLNARGIRLGVVLESIESRVLPHGHYWELHTSILHRILTSY